MACRSACRSGRDLKRTPERGEIWLVDLDPIAGKEQRGRRPVFVVTRAALNASGLALICPISQGALQSRFAGFASSLVGSGTATQGVVMCNQPRTVDLVARRSKRVEMAPDFVVEDVLARITVLLD